MDVNSKFFSLATSHKLITQGSDLSGMRLQTWVPSGHMAPGPVSAGCSSWQGRALCCPGSWMLR